jgi:DNA-binding LytR/AlgR family response regulator
MAKPDTNWLARYRPYRRRFEIGYWVAVLALETTLNSVVTWIDRRRSVPGFEFWQPFLWELSSALVVGLLIPMMIAFERRYPLRWDTLPRNIARHVAASVAFCLAHLALMYALRYPVYALLGRNYGPGNWATETIYQYLKDVRSYVAILAAVLGYRFVLLRLQGEARVLDTAEPAAGDPPAPAGPAARPERFLVRKLRKEFLIAAADIEWLQAQSNYVGLHVSGHDYLLRSTLSDFLQQLDPARFVQVHRSYAVNLDRVAEIEPTDGGDARLRMKDGSQVPCSRRYRDALGPTR